MVRGGRAAFFDGVTSARHAVLIEIMPASLRITGADGNLHAEWPYAGLRSLDAPEAILRLGQAGSGTLARLEILDPVLAQAVAAHAPALGRREAHERRTRALAVVLSVAAVLALMLGGVFTVPRLATLVAPHVPDRLEMLLGEAVDKEVRTALDAGKSGAAFACGDEAAQKPGAAALAKLVGRLERTAALPASLRVTAIHHADANAIALPGGRIYLFDGLLGKADTPDELAAVLAHEIGHVAHRDGLRSVLQTAGVSFLFGMVLGDFVGGGAVVTAARAALHSSYSREVEAAADAYGVALMAQAGGDPHALAAILARIGDVHAQAGGLLPDHPGTQARIAAINAFPASTSRVILLEPAEWTALKRICT